MFSYWTVKKKHNSQMCHFFVQAKDFAKVWLVSFLHEVKMGEIFSLFCFVLIEDTIFKQVFSCDAHGRRPVVTPLAISCWRWKKITPSAWSDWKTKRDERHTKVPRRNPNPVWNPSLDTLLTPVWEPSSGYSPNLKPQHLFDEHDFVGIRFNRK